MKKFVAVFAAMVLLMLTTTALAAVAVPGETVDVPIYIQTSDACYVKLRISADWCTIVELDGEYGQASGSNMNGAEDPVLPSGQFGTATVKINNDLAPGNYTLTVTVREGWTYDEDFADVTAYSGTITIEAPDCIHVLDEGTVTKPATCIEEGVMTYACTKEGCTYTETKAIEKVDHTWGEWTETKAPTCTEDGAEERKCQVEGCDAVETQVKTTRGHQNGPAVTTPATCTEPGSVVISCTVCGKEMVNDPIEALGHTEVTETVDATCTVAGSKTVTCSVCKEVLSEEVIEALGHTEVTETVDATCTEAGSKTVTCSVCKEVLSEEVIEALGHTEVTETVEATCTEAGSKTVTCSVCKEVLSEEVIDALGHTEVTETVEATCTEAGSKTVTCSVCKEVLSEEVIEAPGHAWDAGKETTAPTCTAEGVKTFTCTVCGETKTEPIAKAEHSYDEDGEYQAPTCTEDGYAKGVCTVCGAVSEGEVIPATGHTEETVTVDSTCTVAGSETVKCSVCDEVISTKELPLAPHTEETVTVDSTCTVAGTETVKCSVCGEIIKTTELPLAPHTEETVIVDSTCAVAGSETVKCSVCGEIIKTTELPLAEHTWDAGAVTTEPGCETEGVKTFTCTVCKETKTEAVEAIGHAYDAGVVTTEPGCETEGVKTFTCKNDASHTYTESIPATGHNWGEWIEGEDGMQDRVCSDCGTVESAPIQTKTVYVMTLCSEGIRFRDLENPVTDYWYMFTPIDLSVDGEQTYDLIAGNIHKIGTVTVLVKEGTVTVTYKLINRRDIMVFEEFMTFLPTLADVTELDFENMTGYEYGEAISIQEQLGGDTKVLLVMRNLATYTEGISGIEYFDYDGEEYLTYAEELKLLMD